MKVALVTDKFHPESNRGFGGFVLISQLARYLKDHGGQVTVFGYPPIPMLDKDICFKTLNKDQPFYALPRLAAMTKDLIGKRDDLREYEIIHSISGTSIPALYWIKGEYTRFIFDMQNDMRNPRRDYNFYKRTVLSFFSPDFVMFIDPISLNLYCQIFGRDNCAYYPPSVDTTVFSPRTLDRQQGLENKVRVLYAGVLRKSKGLLDLLSAMERVFEVEPQAQLVIAGYGPLQDYVMMRARQSDQVKYLGFVAHEDMPRIYNGVDLFVLPSSFEGFPRSIIEAMACGLPVITTPISGMITLDESSGVRLINPGDVEELTNALMALLTDKELRLKDGRAAREYVVSEHSPEAFFPRIQQLYTDLLGKH